MTTKWTQEQRTIKADPGMELIGFTIRHGVLLGAMQQRAALEASVQATDRGSAPEEWYTIATVRQKEESGSNAAEGGTNYRHFDSYAAAKAAWSTVAAEHRSKLGRAAILVDSLAMSELRSAGGDVAAAVVRIDAKKSGFLAESKDEDAGMLDAIRTMFRLIGEKSTAGVSSSDMWMLLFVMALLAASFYLELEAQLLTGHVMTIVSPSANSSEVTANWFVRQACVHAVDCESTPTAFRLGLIVAFVGCRVVERLLYVLNVYFHHNACDNKNHQLKVAAFNHVLSLDQTFYDTHSVSEIKGSMNVHSLNNLITWNIPYLCTLVLQLAMTAAMMVRIHPVLGAWAIIGMLVIRYGVLRPMERLESKVHKVHRKLNMVNEHIVDEAFGMLSSVKMFAKEAFHAEEHEAGQQRYMAAINQVVVLRCAREFAYGILRCSIFAGILYHGMNSFKSGELTAAGLTGMYLLFQKFQDNFGRVKWHYELLVREFPDIERFVELMKAESKLTLGGVKPRTVATGEIEFKGVRFEYPSRPGEEVLKGLNLKVRPGKMTAIVGDSGAGKSTIAKLLLRLYDPKEGGQVTLDGVDLRDLDNDYLHDQICIVNQNPDLFNASLADNIGYGASVGVYDHGNMKKSAKLANCDFAGKFRAGFDTFAGAKGNQLSGGQKQRIAIARAAMRDSSVLILDEATSALDAENEKLVQEALERIMHGRTIIVIAHRLSTIKNADEIVCMKDGEVVEQGTHAALMANRSSYFNLINKQLASGPPK